MPEGTTVVAGYPFELSTYVNGGSDALAGAEAVEHRAAGKTAVPQLRVDAATEVLAQVRARHPGRLVDGEVGGGGERRRHAAEPGAARAVSIGPQ